MAHARLSPSSAARWTTCSASVRATDGLPDSTSEAARQGTAEHLVLEESVLFSEAPQRYLGRTVQFWSGDTESGWTVPPGMEISNTITLDQDAIDRVESAYAFVERVATMTNARVYSERRVPIGHVTGEHGAMGTSDLVLLYGRTLHVMDYKGGRKPVEVRDANGRPNLQLALYALGVIEDMGLTTAEIDDVVLTILQPMLGRTPETRLTMRELLDVGDWLRERAREIDNDPKFQPSKEACEFCRYKPSCKPAEDYVMEAVNAEFSGARLGALYERLTMIRAWADSIEAAVLDTLLAGKPVTGEGGAVYALDTGRRGNRVWSDPDKVAAVLVAANVPEDLIYEPRAIRSPAKIESDAKNRRAAPAKIAQTIWLEVARLVPEPTPGGPVVKLATEVKTPYQVSRLSGFTDMTKEV